MSVDQLWEDIFSTRAWGKYPAEEFVRFLAVNYYQKTPRHAVRIFEAGFGVGANLWYAAREGFTVCGVEGSPTGCNLAIARLDAEAPDWKKHGGSLLVGDICQAFAYPPDYFDVVLDSDAVTCNDFDQSRAIYAELFRVAKPGARMYVRTPAVGCWGEGTGEAGGYRQWRCAEGPFAGTGFVRFTGEEDIASLLGPWTIKQTEQTSRTLNARTRSVTEWVVTASKE